MADSQDAQGLPKGKGFSGWTKCEVSTEEKEKTEFFKPKYQSKAEGDEQTKETVDDAGKKASFFKPKFEWKVELSQGDEHIKKVVDDVKDSIEEETGFKVLSIDVHSYKKQVVPAMKYHVKAILKTEDGCEKIAHLGIHKEVKLMSIELNKEMKDEIKGFN